MIDMYVFTAIISKEVDPSGYYRVLADCTDGTLLIQFPEDPSNELIQSTLKPICERLNMEASLVVTPNLPMSTPEILNLPDTKEYLKGYYGATRSLRQLAGISLSDNEWVKLEDTEYQTTLMTALSLNKDNPYNMGLINTLCSTILYTFTQLTLKLNLKWDDFTYDGSY